MPPYKTNNSFVISAIDPFRPREDWVITVRLINLYSLYSMKTRKKRMSRRGGKYIENVLQLVQVSAFGLKIAIKTVIAATTTIPQEILHQYIYSKFREIFSQLYAGFYNVQREVLQLLETKEAAEIFKKLDINKSEFIKVVKKALDFIKRCISSQSIRSITEWFPIAVELMRVSKMLINNKVNPDFVERVSALMETFPKTKPQGDKFFQKEPVPNTNPSESNQQLMNRTKTLFENLVHDKPLLEGIFETSESDMLEGLEKTVSGPAISAVQTLIDEILYLYVTDIGNLYTKIYSDHQELRDAIVTLIDKGIYMACMSQLVPIKPKDIEDLRKRPNPVSESTGEIATILRLSATKLPKDLELIVFLIRKL
jgi:hypothetical protein